MGDHDLGNMERTKLDDLRTVPDPPKGNPGRGDGFACRISKSDGNTKDRLIFVLSSFLYIVFKFPLYGLSMTKWLGPLS